MRRVGLVGALEQFTILVKALSTIVMIRGQSQNENGHKKAKSTEPKVLEAARRQPAARKGAEAGVTAKNTKNPKGKTAGNCLFLTIGEKKFFF